MFDSVDIAVREAEIDDLRDQIKTLTAERDALKRALEQITITYEPSPVLTYQAMEQVAHEALAKVSK